MLSSCHGYISSISSSLTLTSQETLPFIAYPLLVQLDGSIPSEEPIQHAIHHDVESVFQAIAHKYMRSGGDIVQPWSKKTPEDLCSLDTNTIMVRKLLLLESEGRLLSIGGCFASQ